MTPISSRLFILVYALARLVESSRPLRREDLVVLGRCAVRQRELEVLGEELADVRAADVVGLLDLDDLEDLYVIVNTKSLPS